MGTQLASHHNVQHAHAHLRSCIQRVATGPEYSKDVSFDEARDAMRYILEDVVDPVQAGIYLIALRMKRETDDENGGTLQAILDCTQQIVVNVDTVLDIADPYDGYTRGLPMTPFLPAVLAAAGQPAVCHGLESVGPKFGITQRKVLRAAGIPVDLSPSQAGEQINNQKISWAYIDQKYSCPQLHDLVPLRQKIVKRPVITTVEVLTGPIRGKHSTHLMTGYVHKPYPPIYAKLAKLAKFNSAVIIRGVEGGVVPSLKQPAKYYQYHNDNELEEIEINPQDAMIHCESRAVPLPTDTPNSQNIEEEMETNIDVDALAQKTAHVGVAALKGESGPARDSLLYAGAIALKHLNKVSTIAEGVQKIATAIDSGEALNRFQAAT